MPPYWKSAAGDGRAVEGFRVIMVGGRGGMGKTRLLGEVPRLDAAAVEARALALVEVEARHYCRHRGKNEESPPGKTCGRVRVAPSTVHTL